MERGDIERLEIDLLLEAIHRRYGHDFRSYARNHIERRVKQFMARSDCCGSISEMIPRVLHDEMFFGQFLASLSITVTEMFRNPYFYRALREQIAPILQTYPFIKVWVAGCATGEEAYSMAILLKEEGLYSRTTLFATDFNDIALQKAREGIYDIDQIRVFTQNYNQSGARGAFSEYYHAHYGGAAMDRSLKDNIVFANHNLAVDAVFSETHLILCRNVLIYFGRNLRERVFTLFTESLVYGGYLCLGSTEDLQFTEAQRHYRSVDKKARIFQKKNL